MKASEGGRFVVDGRDGRVGKVVGREGASVRLRPPGGGREWECPREAARVAGRREVLRAKVAELNQVSRLP